VAALNDKLSTAALLLANGANANAQETDSGNTPLYIAASFGREDVVGLLLEKGADPNIVNLEGWSPLHAALVNGYKDIAGRIRARGGR
jgi:ankyrin repeat protein